MTHTKYKNKAGKVVPSVTTIIGKNLGHNKDMLLAWYAREFEQGRDPRKTSSTACDYGTLVHTMIEHHIFGQDEMELPDGVTNADVMKAAEALEWYKKWETDNNVVYLESELMMVSENDQTGGCCDAIAMVNGVVTLIDFKTSKHLYEDHIIQIGQYRSMIHELTDYKIEQCIVIKISKTAEIGEDHITPFVLDNDMVTYGKDTFDILRKLHVTGSDMGKYIRRLTKEMES